MNKHLFLAILLSFTLFRVQAQSAAFTSDAPQCVSAIVHFTPAAPGGTILSESWDFGDGTVLSVGSPGPFPVFATHAYATYGIFTVTRTVQFTTGTLSANLQVQINPAPVAYFSWNANPCSGQPVQFMDLSYIASGLPGNYIASWMWNFGDGTPPLFIVFPSSPNVTHTFAGTALAHNVTLTVVSSTGCSHSITRVVSTSPNPVANFSWTPVWCSSDPVQFTDLSQTNGGGQIVMFNWSFGDPASGVNGTSTAQNPVHIFASPGIFLVRLIVTSVFGCNDTIIQAIPVPQIPDITGPAQVNVNETATYMAGQAGMSNYIWSLSGGGTIVTGSGTSQVKVQWPAAGAQTISLSYVPTCFMQAGLGMKSVTVTQPPPQQVTLPSLNIAAGHDTCFGAQQWITAGGSGNSFTVQPGGIVNMVAGHRITLYDGVSLLPGCYFRGRITQTNVYCPGDQPVPARAQFTTGVEKVQGSARFRVYPNPVKDQLIIEPADGEVRSYTCECFNRLGVPVASGRSAEGIKTILRLVGNRPGVFFLVITSEQGTVQQKIILSTGE